MINLSDRAGFLILASFVKYATGFILPMVMVRMLNQGDYGTYQQLVLVSTVVIGVMNLGLPTSIYYFYHQVSKAQMPALIMQTSLILSIGGMAASTVIYLGSSTISDSLNNSSMSEYLSVYAFSILLIVAVEHSIPLMHAQNRYVLAVCFEISETLIRVALLLMPLWLGYGVMGAVYGMVAFASLRFCARAVYIFAFSGEKFSGWSKFTSIRHQLDYSLPIALNSLAALIGSTFNKGIVAMSFGPAQYAIYSVGDMPIPLASIFQTSVANVLRASLPPLVRDGELIVVVGILREATRKLSIIVLPSFFFLYGHAHEFVTLLFTNEYAESVSVFRIFILALPLDMLVLSPIPQIFGRTRLNLYINLATYGALIALSYFLLKAIGFYGPVIAIVIAQYLGSLLFFITVARLTHGSIASLLPLEELLRVSVVSLIALWASRFAYEVGSSMFLTFPLAVIVFCFVFLSSAAIGGVFTASDRQLIRRWIAKVLPFVA